jgi:hypothetical protein
MDRWSSPVCDLCGKPEVHDREHIFPPDLTFQWCRDCSRNSRATTAKIHAVVADYWGRPQTPPPARPKPEGRFSVLKWLISLFR